jgi:Co/Zn/Cd efflux system component
MSLKKLRAGELLALAGIVSLTVSLFEPWYHGSIGRFDLWDTFGPGAVLLLVALVGALTLVASALTERNNAALPVSSAVWCVLLGLIGLIAAIVRLLDTPEHAGSLNIGPWLALAGTLAILVGAWEVLRDERPSRYTPARPEPRPRP